MSDVQQDSFVFGVNLHGVKVFESGTAFLSPFSLPVCCAKTVSSAFLSFLPP
jgi:hypothetical protein